MSFVARVNKLGAMLSLLAVLAATAVASADANPASASPEVNPHDQLQRILEQPIYQRWKLRQMRVRDSVAACRH